MESMNLNNSRGYTEMAMKVNKARSSKASLSNKIGYYAAIAFFGLGVTSSPLAIIPAGVATMSVAHTAIEMEKNVIKSNVIKRKFKRVAKRVKNTCGINIRPEYNYSTRQAGFVLCDMSGKIPITSFLTSENMSDYLNPEQCAIINDSIIREFATMNSYRGLGTSANTIKEFKYRNFAKIGLDNMTSAFDEVGGVLTNKELIDLSQGTKISRVEYKNFMGEHKGESLWVFSGHLSSYLNSLTDMSVEDKNDILREFKHYFEKQGDQGMYEFQKLSEQINLEETEMKRVV